MYATATVFTDATSSTDRVLIIGGADGQGSSARPRNATFELRWSTALGVWEVVYDTL